jgi:hypothetical protein
MKKIVIFSCFSFLAVFVFAAFPVETQNLLTEADPEKFKLDTLGFILGILTILLMPYSLLLLFIRKKNFRGSLAWGWLAGLVLIILLVIAIELVPSGGLLLY